MAEFTQVATNEDIAAIADAIRYAEGSEADMTISEMPAKIRALKKTLIEKTITENGEYLPASDEADGYSKVTVNVGGLPPVSEITDLSGTKWLLNEQLNLDALATKDFRISGRVIESGHALNIGAIYCGNNRQLGVTYTYFIQGSLYSQLRIMYDNGSYTTGWGTYGREILIAGGGSETDTTLVAWFKANATLVGYMPPQ